MTTQSQTRNRRGAIGAIRGGISKGNSRMRKGAASVMKTRRREEERMGRRWLKALNGFRD